VFIPLGGHPQTQHLSRLAAARKPSVYPAWRQLRQRIRFYQPPCPSLLEYRRFPFDYGVIMRSERVWFGFFVLLALTLNFGFVYGDVANPEHHDKLELFFAFIISLVCTIMKFGDRSHLGSLMLAASLVADVQLFCAVCAWTFSVSLLESSTMATIVSFTAGALIANIISVVLVVIEAATLRR